MPIEFRYGQDVIEILPVERSSRSVPVFEVYGNVSRILAAGTMAYWKPGFAGQFTGRDGKQHSIQVDVKPTALPLIFGQHYLVKLDGEISFSGRAVPEGHYRQLGTALLTSPFQIYPLRFLRTLLWAWRTGLPFLEAAVATGDGFGTRLSFLFGQKISSQGNGEDYALTNAARSGNTRMVRILLNHGIHPDGPNAVMGRTTTPLISATSWGHVSIVDLLVRAGANVECVDGQHETPLFIAAEGGHEEIVRLLLEQGAETMFGNDLGRTPLYAAARSRRRSICKMLIEHGSDVNARDRWALTPLMMACGAYSIEMSTWFYDRVVARENNCEPLPMDISLNLYSPPVNLHAFRLANQSPPDSATEVARELLDHGADVNAADTIGLTALHAAVARNDRELVQILLGHGADPNLQTTDGRNSVHFCAWESSPDIMRLLLENGADANAPDRFGDTPLHRAACGYDESVVEILLEYGADINAQWQDGTTPLDLALRTVKPQPRDCEDTVYRPDSLSEEKRRMVRDKIRNLLLAQGAGRGGHA